GKVLFSEKSDGLCRVNAPPRQEAIKSVEIRNDGAVLINDKPRYLMGATHQDQRLAHSPEIIAQLGLMGHRLLAGEWADVRKMWTNFGLYDLQFKPIDKAGSIDVILNMTDAQKKALQDFVAAGGMDSIVSVNTGGWESSVPDTAEARASHEKVNAFVREL